MKGFTLHLTDSANTKKHVRSDFSTTGAIRHDELKTREASCGPYCPRTVSSQGWSNSCYFSNANQLVYLFAEHSFPIGNTHLCI